MKFSKWINSELESNFYTPDMPDVYAKDDHYLFVYGQLKNGEYSEDVMEDEVFVAEAYTKYASYGMMNYTNAYGVTMPMAYGETKHGMGSFIKGELYYVTTDKLIEIDYLYSNNVQTRRVTIPVVTADRHLQCMAWVYFLHTSFEINTQNKGRLETYNKRHFIWNTPTIEWHSPETSRAAA